MERPKLELDINQPSRIRLLFDEAIVGESQYGKYYLYAVSNGNNKEYSFFAPDVVHEKLKDCKKGTEAVITKIASQKDKKLVTAYDVQIIGEQNPLPAPNKPQTNPYLENMLDSFADALVVQEKFNGMANVNQIAITMFIQRTKGNGFSHE